MKISILTFVGILLTLDDDNAFNLLTFSHVNHFTLNSENDSLRLAVEHRREDWLVAFVYSDALCLVLQDSEVSVKRFDGAIVLDVFLLAI